MEMLSRARITLTAIKQALSHPWYLLLAIATSMAMLAFAVWLPNLDLISHELGDGSLPLLLRLKLPIDLLGGLATNFTAFSFVTAVLISVLFGIDIALFAYYVSHRIAVAKSAGMAMGFGGIVSGVLGIGCAMCGSVIVTGGLSLLGASGILIFLPLRGGEFSVLGVVLLLVSLVAVAKRIAAPEVCKV